MDDRAPSRLTAHCSRPPTVTQAQPLKEDIDESLAWVMDRGLVSQDLALGNTHEF
jgi:hypothetical protein